MTALVLMVVLTPLCVWAFQRETQRLEVERRRRALRARMDRIRATFPPPEPTLADHLARMGKVIQAAAQAYAKVGQAVYNATRAIAEAMADTNTRSHQ